MGIAKSLIEVLAESDPVSITVEIGRLILSTNNERQRLMDVLNAARSREAAVRGEVRIDFEHIASYGTILYEQFGNSNLSDKLVVISTDTIVDLITCYTMMLFDPIIFNLGRIHSDLRLRETGSFNSIVTTITTFESLLHYTLFSGTTHSYVRKLIWATGPTAHSESLKLMNSIKLLNHPVFSGALWDTGNLRIVNGDNEILEDMMFRLAGRRKLSIEAIKLMLAVLSDRISPLELAIMLWTSYFNEIPSADFADSYSPRWRLNSLNPQGVRYTANPISIREAATKIFNKSNLSSLAWRKPYLRAFKYWDEKDSSVNAFELIVKAGTQILCVEIVRYHCGTERFFATGHMFQKIRTGQDIPIANRQAFRAISDSVNETIAAAESSPGTGVRRGRGLVFEKYEDVDLIRGYNSFHASNSTWMDIKTCSQLCFSGPESQRDNISLKDRFRNLKIKHLICTDPMNSDRYLIPGFAEECRRPCEKTRRLRASPSNRRAAPRTPPREGRVILILENNTHQQVQERVIPATPRIPFPNPDRVRNASIFVDLNMPLDSDLQRIFTSMTRNVTNNYVSSQSEIVSNESLPLSPPPTSPSIPNLMIPQNSDHIRKSSNLRIGDELSVDEDEGVSDEESNSPNSSNVQLFEDRNNLIVQNGPVLLANNINLLDPFNSLMAEISTSSEIDNANFDDQNASLQQRQLVLNIIREFMSDDIADTMLSRLLKIPDEFQEYRFTNFSNSIPRLWKTSNNWKICYFRLLEDGFIIANEQKRIKRNF